MKCILDNISVVVQGATNKITPKCLQSIRKNLPNAEIILSTWEDCNVENLDFDVLVLNKDPGAKIQDFRNKTYNNTNRLLYSTQEGLKKASKKYVLKMRSDLVLKNVNFLNYFNSFPVRKNEFSIFKKRVIVSSIYAREYSPTTQFLTPFHPSDFYFFGLKDDIMNYFMKTNLLENADLSNYKYLKPNQLPFENLTWRFAPEQYFCISWAKRNKKINGFEDWTDWSEDLMNLSNNILYNNFIFLDGFQSGIFSSKHKSAYENEYKIKGLITYKKFEKMYSILCDSSFEREKDNVDFFSVLISFAHLKKHLKNLILPIFNFIKSIYCMIVQVFDIIYYFIVLLRNIFLAIANKIKQK